MKDFDNNLGWDEAQDENLDEVLETVITPKENLTPTRDYSLMGFGIMLFYILWNVFVVAGTILYIYVSKSESGEIDYTAVVIISALAELLGIFPYLLLARKVSYTPIEKTASHATFGTYIKAMCLVFALSVAGNLIGNIINSLIVKSGGTASSSAITDLASGNFVLMFLFAAVFAPVIEEFLMRKVLIDRIYKYGRFKAMITSGLVFGLIHGNLEQFFYAFLIGCLFAYIYITTGKLKYTIILHMSMNSYSMILMLLYTLMAKSAGIGSFNDLLGMANGDLVQSVISNDSAVVFLTVAVVMAIAEYLMAFIGIIYLLTHLNTISISAENETKFPVFKTILSPVMILCYISLIAVIVLPTFL